MVENPTVVIGVGEAGTKIAADLYEDVASYREDDFSDEFKFIAIDTQESDLQNHAKDDFHEIELEPQERTFEARDSAYIRPGMELDPRGGASRQRSSSRFYIDNTDNFTGFFEELYRELDSFATTADGNPNVWIVNSLGGGTGSGALPLLSAIVSNITDEIQDANFWIGGIGSLPRLDGLDEGNITPEDDANLYANAYAALRELAVLLDYEFTDIEDGHDFRDASGQSFDDGVSISIEADTQRIKNSEITLEDPPFDFYGLMGLHEGKSESYQREMNKIAAYIMLYFAHETGLEDFGRGLLSDPNELPVLFSLDSASMDIPVGTLKEYVDLTDSLSDREEAQRDKILDINTQSANHDAVSEILDRSAGEEFPDAHPIRKDRFDPANGQVLRDPLDSGVDTGVNHQQAWTQVQKLLGTAREQAAEFPVGQFDDKLLEERETELLDNHEALTGDYVIESEPIVLYLFYQELVREFKTARKDHPFSELMAEEVEKRRDFIDQKLDVQARDLAEKSPTEKWEVAVQEVYTRKIKALERKIENTRFYQVSTRNNLEERLEQITSRFNSLQNEYRTYLAYEDGLAEATKRKSDTEVELKNTRSTLSDKISSLRSRLDDLNKRINQLQNTRSSLEATLEESVEAKNDRFIEVPFTDFESVTDETLMEADGIPDLVTDGVVEAEEVLKGLSGLMERLEDQVEDGDVKVIQNTRSILGVLANEQNKRLPQGSMDDEVPGQSAGGEFDQFDDSNVHEFDHWSSIRLVGMFTNIALENTSEFGTIHELYRSQHPVSNEFATDLPDEEFITDKFAYPELFPDDEAIQQRFTKKLD
jgi:hypothetical protein